MVSETAEGLVLRAGSSFCTLVTETGEVLVASLTKKLRQGGRTHTTSAVIGDRVIMRRSPGRTSDGVVDSVSGRHNELYRLAPGRRTIKDVLAANLDSLLVVHSLRLPDFTAARLDRFLAIAEQAEIPAAVVLNKADLAPADEADAIADAYRQSGYPVIISSAKTCAGIDEIQSRLSGISALIGPSGVGKSTILNQILPDLALRTAEVNDYTGKGKHTTVASELLPLGHGAYVADTPGMRSIALTGLDRYEVASVFRELRPLIGSCRFPDCLHLQEPGCAVKAAVADGGFSAERYDSYQKLLEHVIDGYVEDWEAG
ncbi:MAG TPA: ribosome small subunit-dependent GTPase A [Chloroflexota bacterium]|jgi:ribosome biogenesis GTPase|nr:ribosome small subunit-dependent GTPase A [Chloroflexota bacterium]